MYARAWFIFLLLSPTPCKILLIPRPLEQIFMPDNTKKLSLLFFTPKMSLLFLNINSFWWNLELFYQIPNKFHSNFESRYNTIIIPLTIFSMLYLSSHVIQSTAGSLYLPFPFAHFLHSHTRLLPGNHQFVYMILFLLLFVGLVGWLVWSFKILHMSEIIWYLSLTYFA